jgi:hypothetical protein
MQAQLLRQAKRQQTVLQVQVQIRRQLVLLEAQQGAAP